MFSTFQWRLGRIVWCKGPRPKSDEKGSFISHAPFVKHHSNPHFSGQPVGLRPLAFSAFYPKNLLYIGIIAKIHIFVWWVFNHLKGWNHCRTYTTPICFRPEQIPSLFGEMSLPNLSPWSFELRYPTHPSNLSLQPPASWCFKRRCASLWPFAHLHATGFPQWPIWWKKSCTQ